jgi:Flp pilus assembly pilin Flp
LAHLFCVYLILGDLSMRTRHFQGVSVKKSLGQGMTEYIIIVALIAIAAIGVYSAFGGVVKGQVGAMAAELGGKDGKTAATFAGAQGTEAAARGAEKHDLSNYQDAAAKSR